jgi:hypothetical protein
MTLPYIPKTPEEQADMIVELERRISNIEGIGGTGLSHSKLADISDHERFLKNDGTRTMRANLNMGDNRIIRAGNPILKADTLKGEVAINPRTNQLEVMGPRIKSFDIEPAITTRGPSAPTLRTYQNFPVLDFDKSVVSQAYQHIEVPHDFMTAGLMQMHFTFFVESPANATVIWGIEYKKLSEGDVFDFTAGTSTLTTTFTLQAADSTRQIYKSDSLVLNTSGWTSNDTIATRFYRDGVTDTYAPAGASPTGAARLMNIHVEYASNRRGEPLYAEQGE